MRHATTFRMVLPCPTCGIIDRQVVTLTSDGSCSAPSARDIASVPDGTYRARVAECGACWRRRARAISTAREHLMAMGALRHGRGVTWMGASVEDAELDPVENAIASDLLRLGIPVTAEPLEVLIHVRRGRPALSVPLRTLQPA